mgnify:CR=1 FL=1
MTVTVHQISGNLTIETVAQLFDCGLDFAEKKSLVVDLEQVLTVDSAAVSLLLAWVRQAQGNGLDLSFTNIPENLLSLANLYGVTEMLPLQSNQSV